MAAWVVALLVACALAAAVCAEGVATPSFTGTWTDTRRFNNSLYLCTPTANTLYGSYSNYGVLVGGLKNFRTVEGKWYEACTGKCCRGEFKLVLSHDGSSFSGSWTCIENLKRAFAWTETRDLTARTQTPNDYQCAVLTTTSGNNLNHQWSYAPFSASMDTCLSTTSNNYSLSYSITYTPGDTTIGYETGSYFQSGRITQGYFDEPANSGTSLTVLLKNNQFLNFRWITNSRNTTVSKTNPNSALIWNRDLSGEPTLTSCNRYSFISSAPATVNAATSPSASMVAVLAVVIVAVLAVLF